jgi:hypothetical protein
VGGERASDDEDQDQADAQADAGQSLSPKRMEAPHMRSDE